MSRKKSRVRSRYVGLHVGALACRLDDFVTITERFGYVTARLWHEFGRMETVVYKTAERQFWRILQRLKALRVPHEIVDVPVIFWPGTNCCGVIMKCSRQEVDTYLMEAMS